MDDQIINATSIGGILLLQYNALYPGCQETTMQEEAVSFELDRVDPECQTRLFHGLSQQACYVLLKTHDQQLATDSLTIH